MAPRPSSIAAHALDHLLIRFLCAQPVRASEKPFLAGLRAAEDHQVRLALDEVAVNAVVECVLVVGLPRLDHDEVVILLPGNFVSAS